MTGMINPDPYLLVIVGDRDQIRCSPILLLTDNQAEDLIDSLEGD